MELPEVKASTPMPACKPLKCASDSLRDQIAIEVMKAVVRPILELGLSETEPAERIAFISYGVADAMLAERAR